MTLKDRHLAKKADAKKVQELEAQEKKRQAAHNLEATKGNEHDPLEERLSQLETELARSTVSAAKSLGQASDHIGYGGAASGLLKRKITDRMHHSFIYRLRSISLVLLIDFGKVSCANALTVWRIALVSLFTLHSVSITNLLF